MKYLRNTVVLAIGGGLLVFLGIWAFGKYNEVRGRDRIVWEEKLADAQDSLEAYRKAGTRDSIEYRDVIVPKYVTIREQVLRDPRTPDATGKVIRACDLIVSACDSIQGGLRGQIRSLEVQNELLRHKPGPARAVGYGDILYDVVGLRPVVRVGGNVKIMGPLHVRAEGEYAIPSQLRTGVGDGFRVLLGARINFNR